MYKKLISYSEAIGNALKNNMKKNKNIIIAGLEVNYSSKVFGSLKEPFNAFPDRFIQSPAMENGLCTILAGSAITGIRPVFVNNRCDFLLLAFDPIVNIIDKWKYMYDGNAGTCPIIITAVIGRGWGQGATHSQTFHNFFSRLNGFDVFLPTFPSDIKNVLNYTLKSNRPSIILEHRGLFEIKENFYKKKKFLYGKANIVRKGKDLAIITLSYGTIQSIQVYKELKKHFQKKITIIDLLSVKPLDMKLILNTAKKHKSILIIDIDSAFSGIASEISYSILEKYKNKKIRRLGNELSPTPTANNLENLFYPSNQKIFDECCKLLKISNKKKKIDNNYKFVGPY